MEQGMKRREFLRQTALAAGGALLAASAAAAEKMPEKFKGYHDVDATLFQGVNRALDPAKKSELEQKHAPVIEAPATVKAGEPFAVTVTVGEVLHPMTVAHAIQWIELFAGNEPAGRVDFRPGFNLPKATFHLTLDKPVTLVAREYCNLHGLWESRREVALG
jgi:superoxide reductase